MPLKLKPDDHDSHAGKICPSCGHERPVNSPAPTWQCPACGVAYEKVNPDARVASKRKSSATSATIRKTLVSATYPLRKWSRVTEIIILLSLVTGFFSHSKHSIPLPSDISSALYQNPLQTFVHEPLIHFDYQNRTVEAKPVANYDLWGLVMSQNDNTNWLWGFRKDEVNFKDICVIWGDNLADGAYQNFSIWNKQWECFVDIPPLYAPFFHPSQLSNNHLLSNSAETRAKIWGLEVGDQIHLTGQLVNYHYLNEVSTPHWRNSSIRREDSGNGACEVILVKDLEVLSAHNPIYHYLFIWSLILGGLALLMRVALFIGEWRYYKEHISR